MGLNHLFNQAVTWDAVKSKIELFKAHTIEHAGEVGNSGKQRENSGLFGCYTTPELYGCLGSISLLKEIDDLMTKYCMFLFTFQ